MSPDELLTRIQKEDHEKIDSRGAARPPPSPQVQPHSPVRPFRKGR